MKANQARARYTLIMCGCVAACSSSAERKSPLPSGMTGTSNSPLATERTSSSATSVTPEEREFLERLVDAYNAGPIERLQAVATATSSVLLLDMWTGERVYGHLYSSLRSLANSSRWKLMKDSQFPGPFAGSVWKVGSGPPQPCPRTRPSPGEIIYGRLIRSDYFLRWDGEPIDYDDTSSELPQRFSQSATHFVYSVDSSLGFVLRLENGNWSLLGIDALVAPC